MGEKRKRDSLPAKPTKNKKKKIQKNLVPITNKFDQLPEAHSDDEIAKEYDVPFRASTPDIVLLDSESEDDVVVLSDLEQQPAQKKAKTDTSIKETQKDNELANNEDFIGFEFDSSGGEENGDNYDNYSDDGMLSADEHSTMSAKASSPYPWVKDHDHSKQQEIADWLTMEMKDFVNYISPRGDEIVQRNTIVNRLKREINRYWPHAQAHVFGSCATDLYLPGSDIDMVVISKTGDLDQRLRLYQLSSFLRTNKLAKNIEVIAKAKVPIIKFNDPESGIPVDISFEKSNGLDAARKIRKWLASTPGLRELVLVVKQFLRSRKLNNVHVGGLGGYSTIVLCYHFLKLHPKLSTDSMMATENLGALLIEFFELYGRNFAYDNLIISLDPETDLPRYILKKQHRWLDTSNSLFAIIIQDPSDPTNNISRSSYNLRDIKKAFGGAYQLLVEKCYYLNSASYKERLGQLILGDIIKYKGSERDFNDDRGKVVNEALIQHDEDEEEDGESDGFDGNDKYYFSDMTVEESDDGIKKPEPEQKQPPKKAKKAKSESKKAQEVQKKSVQNGEVLNNTLVSLPAKPDLSTPTERKKIVLEHLGIDEEDESKEEADTPKGNFLDKDTKRDYWRQKGLEL